MSFTMGDTTSMGKGLRPRPIPLLSLLLVLLLLLVSHVSAQAEEPDYTCSETRPWYVLSYNQDTLYRRISIPSFVNKC